MKKDLLNAAGRHILRALGLGAAGTVTVLAVMAPERIFAKQFASDSPAMMLPKMTYDRTLQMMVDPETRLPIYENPKTLQLASGLPTVTAGCGNCPKKDDDGS